MKKPYIKSVILFIIPVVLTGMLCSCDSEEKWNIDLVKREASLRNNKALENKSKLSKFNQAIDILNEYEILDESEMHVDLFTKKYTGTKRAKISHEIRTHAKYVNDGIEEITDYPYLLSLFELKDYVDAAASVGWMLKNIPDTEKLPSKAFDKAIQLLKEAGADVNAKDKDGSTALMNASYNGNVEVVKALIAAGADVNAKSNNGWTALMNASNKGHVEAVKALIAAGADVNAKYKDGSTALMNAVSKGYVEIVKALIAAGADVNAKDKDGWTALDYAKNSSHREELIKILKEAGAR